MTIRCRSPRSLVYLVAFAVAGLVMLGAPMVAYGQDPQTGQQTQNGPHKTWRHRHPVLFDTLIGTAAGAAVGCALGAAAQDHEDVSCAYLAAPYGLLGAAIGVVPGIVTERRYERDPLSFDELRRHVKPGTTVVVLDASGNKTTGKVVDVTGDSLSLRAGDGSTRTISGDATIWHLTSDSLTNGILIGAALGAAISVANYKDGAGAGAITGVPIWALLGALADRAFGHQRLTANEPGGRSAAIVKVTPWLGKRSSGVSVAVAF